MIPRLIHYCWLSNDPVPESLQKCMDSWKTVLPDYEWVHWNFDRFPKEQSLWVSQAFDNKKYAFAADYIRLYALYHHGGIYLDMDVEVLKSYDEFLELPSMLCFENSKDGRLEVAAFGVEKGSQWVKDCLAYYENRAFVKKNGTFDTKVLPGIIKNCLIQNGYTLKPVSSIAEAKSCSGKEIPVFPYQYFSPKSYGTGKIEKSDLTYSIHHFAGTWLPWYTSIEKKICASLGLTYRDTCRNILRRLGFNV